MLLTELNAVRTFENTKDVLRGRNTKKAIEHNVRKERIKYTQWSTKYYTEKLSLRNTKCTNFTSNGFTITLLYV